MRLANFLPLLIALVYGWTAPVAAQGPPDEDAPVQVTAHYLAALLSQDAEAITALLCAESRADLDIAALTARLEAIRVLDFTANLDDLAYTVTAEGKEWAQVTVSGELALQVPPLAEPLRIPPAALRLDTFWPVHEDDRWMICPRPPERALPELEPANVAFIFLRAAFGGDYTTASALVCQQQADAFSEEAYTAAFSDFVTGQAILGFDEVTFEVTDQADEAATVTVTGTVALYAPGRRQAVSFTPAQLGWETIALVADEGWKVCQPASAPAD
jgi:hypothetical protein